MHNTGRTSPKGLRSQGLRRQDATIRRVLGRNCREVLRIMFEFLIILANLLGRQEDLTTILAGLEPGVF